MGVRSASSSSLGHRLPGLAVLAGLVVWCGGPGAYAQPDGWEGKDIRFGRVEEVAGRHRVMLSYHAEAESIVADEVITELLATT